MNGYCRSIFYLVLMASALTACRETPLPETRAVTGQTEVPAAQKESTTTASPAAIVQKEPTENSEDGASRSVTEGPPQEEEESTEKEKAVPDKKPEERKTRKRPKITFDKLIYDYGHIEQGEIVSHRFRFRNEGEGDLVISGVTASCGCTRPSYPFIPIAPGEEGFIEVTFNSKGKLGKQKPSITVRTNARPHTYTLYLDGIVAEAAEKEEGRR